MCPFANISLPSTLCSHPLPHKHTLTYTRIQGYARTNNMEKAEETLKVMRQQQIEEMQQYKVRVLEQWKMC